ncbi:MAG: ferredoxin-type protein NapG [Rhodoferax sp.]|nr:ferredoxin-type protein NapG [Rhodoferax sp.]NCP55429.1 ferredoxin-type protein NapG [Rhodoferax sp.]PIW10439.1 MAG: ferredoxin-type protein NapG [Comamonadaceae bacterium CG17_big_fil_post_rev_8_21_14_2_50_60_13]PIY26459.1 MAG: ferredoxin-type protein NapG [Comamonadaceae bacterium CG_4_10_14_3_um_filter_60_75]PJC14374.1 MAG: ferredoxin-type protein NapG [Comamonadaceae bacterium CG_4_9_14_0_8_um_filter_60_18]
MSRPSDRRQFILDTAKMACGVGALGLGLAAYSTRSLALPAGAIRPPGAGTEDDFQSACIRCGLCVRDCPYDILKLATPGQAVATGTPFFVARAKPCEMCEDIPCVKACPTGALDHSLTDIKKAKMGLAVLVDQETCLNFLGLRCDVCYRVCPAIDKAITLDLQHNERTDKHTRFLPTVHSEACTGCGKCEASCVLEVAAIKVYPIKLAKGELGSHYRLGWEEKRKAGGKSLVENRNLVDLPDRLPEGVTLPGHSDPGSLNAPAGPTSAGIPDGLATLPGMPAPLSVDAPR